MERNLTSGIVLRNILQFSVPYLLSYFLQTLYGMADLFIIGQFEGVASTTAVSVGSQVMHMITVVLVGLAMGTTVSVARATGAGDHRQATAAIGSTVTLFTLLSLVLTAVLLACVRPIVAVMSTPSEAAAGTADYLTICFLGIPCITAYNIISSIFRGLGDSKSPLYFVAVACAANIVLDYLFMGALHMGPSGAALGRLLKIGLPVALQDGFIQVSFLIISIIANRRGLSDAAAVGIVEKIIGFLFLVPSSMLSTVSALGAQNIGAGRQDRAVRTLRYAILIAAGFGLCAGLAVQWLAEPVVSLFTRDPAVITAGGQYIRGYIWDCLFAGIHFCFSGYFCACGRSELSFLHNILAIFLVRIPGVALASRLFAGTLFPMGLATVFGSVLSVAICLGAYRWLRREDRAPAPAGR